MKIIIGLVLIMGLIFSGCSVIAGGTKSVTSTPIPVSVTYPSIAISVAPAPPSSDTTIAYQPPLLTSPPQFVIIKAQLVFGDSQPGTNLPLGSTIYHWKNYITEAVGPDNAVIFVCKDAEAAQIATPGAGYQPVTRIIGVPDGGMVSPGINRDITKLYDGDKLIGTIVNKPEDFPYTPTQLKNTSQQYIATRINVDNSATDITSQVTWKSSDTSVATISADGLVSALANGNTSITASLQGLTSIAVELTVNSLVSISISTSNGVGPPRPFGNLPVGSIWKLFVKGYYSDGLSFDIGSEVTWISSNPSVATIDSTGLITTVAPGADEITAELSGIISSAITFSVIPSGSH